MRLNVFNSIAFTVLLAGCSAPQHDVRYFPDGTLPPEHDFYGNPMSRGDRDETWYGGALSAMGEPSFADPERMEGTTAYRMLVLPSFVFPKVISVSATTDGVVQARYVVLEGAGDFEPGETPVAKTRRIPADALSALAKDFARLRPPFQDPNFQCMDGTRLVFEELRDGQHRAIDVDECAASVEVAALADAFDALVPESAFELPPTWRR